MRALKPEPIQRRDARDGSGPIAPVIVASQDERENDESVDAAGSYSRHVKSDEWRGR
jgi:hypothetical protein